MMDEKRVEDKGDSAESVEGAASRQNLVDLAVKFLNNPRVWEKPMEDKKAFLRKKGLTEMEIDTAIGQSSPMGPPATTTMGTAPPPLPQRHLIPISHPPLLQSRTWREYAVLAAVAGGVTYALFHFFKNYVIPWFNGPKEHAQKLADVHASVNQLQSTMNQTIGSLAESTRSIQLLMSEQQQHIQLLTSQVTGLQTSLAQQAIDQPLKLLKEELGSLKGIMLSRHQFPPTPTRGGGANGGGIPGWQRAVVTADPATPPKKSTEELSLDATTEEEHGLHNGNGTVVQNETGVQNGIETNGNGTPNGDDG